MSLGRRSDHDKLPKLTATELPALKAPPIPRTYIRTELAECLLAMNNLAKRFHITEAKIEALYDKLEEENHV